MLLLQVFVSGDGMADSNERGYKQKARTMPLM